MFDINFFMKIHKLKKEMMNGNSFDKVFTFHEFERHRSRKPVIYNIETTNACNMKCAMCPRTTMMTRKIQTLDQSTFEKVINQIEPFNRKDWEKWESFIENEYGIRPNEMSENHFYLFIIPQVIQLHGYGDPLLDKNIAKRVEIMAAKGFKTYFSCNPSNIDVNKNIALFESGLDYIKYSIETVDDSLHKKIRGKASNFTESYLRILEILELKKKKGCKTTVVITMLNLNRANQLEDYQKLEANFKDKDVYIYLKSQDQLWYQNKITNTNSVHWSEICQHPWVSMTIKSDGKVAMCMEDFNNDIILGDAKKETLYDIWNGEKYMKFRRDHFAVAQGIKCSEECDMKMVGEYFKN